MPAIWLESSPHTFPLCENCGSELGVSVVREALVFSAPNEIPNEIKDGSVNFARCPVCAHDAWLWTGMLIVDRGKQRAVFCMCDFDLPGLDEQLELRWASLATILTADELSSIRPRIVWVNDYRQIYEVLCEDDRAFDLDFRTDALYRRRRKLQSLNDRARQFVTDLLEAKGAMLRGSEVSPAFAGALKSALKERIDVCCDEPEQKFLMDFLAMVENLAPEVLTAHEETPRSNNQNRMADEDLAIPGAREYDLSRPQHLTDAITKLTRLSIESAEATEKDAGDPPHLADFLDARLWLSGEPSRECGDAQKNLLEQLKRSAPAVTIGEQNIAFSIFLDEAQWDNNSVVTIACQFAFEHAVDTPLFGATLARWLARWWRQTGSHYAKLSSSALCGDYFAQQGMSRHCLASYADACLAFDTEGSLVISVPRPGLHLYAICWQRIGNALGDVGHIKTALLCMGHAAKLFAQAPDPVGTLRSRLFAVSLKKDLPHGNRCADVEQLLGEIIRTKESIEHEHNQVELRELEVECLVSLAVAQYDEWDRSPNVVAMRFGGERENASQPSRCAENEIVLFPFNCPSAPSGKEIATAKEGEDQTKEQKINPGGTVLLTEISLDGENAYVAGVEVSGIAWVHTLRLALTVAATNHDPRWWYGAYTHLVTLVGALHPGVTLYFYRLLVTEAREAGMGDIPHQHLITLRCAVAKSQWVMIKTGESSEVNRTDFDHLLDLLERDALKPSFMATTSRVQGLSRTTRNSASLDALRQRVLPEALTQIAELFEAGGRFTAAIDKYQSYVAYCEDGARKAQNATLENAFRAGRTRALYRMARSALKHHRVTGDEQFLVLALNAIEAYRYHQGISGLAAKFSDAPSPHPAQMPRALQVHEIPGLFPANCYILVIALMQETDINPGFWFIALIRTSDGSIHFPRIIEFEQIYDPARHVIDAFRDARVGLYGWSPNETQNTTLCDNRPLLNALDQIGEALFAPEVVGFLESERADKLVIAPESYLFDVPFAALRIGKKDEKRFLFRLNPKGGTTLSVAPNLTHYRCDDSYRGTHSTPTRKTAVAATLSVVHAWRGNLMPMPSIKSITLRMEQIFANLPTTGNNESTPLDLSSRTVHQFLDTLVSSRIAVFFGHGEISKSEGSLLIADDGVISKHEIEARLQTTRFNAKALILCACSGVGANLNPNALNKHLTGVHVSLLAGGVRCVIGSLVPTFPICGIFLLEQLFALPEAPTTFDRQLLSAYEAFAAHPRLSSPVYWGHLVGFGDSFLNINETVQDRT